VHLEWKTLLLFCRMIVSPTRHSHSPGPDCSYRFEQHHQDIIALGLRHIYDPHDLQRIGVNRGVTAHRMAADNSVENNLVVARLRRQLATQGLGLRAAAVVPKCVSTAQSASHAVHIDPAKHTTDHIKN
jgi:hypothetical protein